MSAHEDDAGTPCERCGVTFDVHEQLGCASDCRCCGEQEDCECAIETIEGEDPETGPWQDTVCMEHGRRV